MDSAADGHYLDLRGNGVTTDIVAQAINCLATMTHGEALALKVDAAEAIDNDVRAWCEATGNHLIKVDDDGEARTYIIEKGVPMSVVHRLALVISSSDPADLEAPLSLALAAALEGVDVSLFFEGDAISVLTSDYPGGGHRGWFGRSRRAARSGAHDRVRRIHDLGGDLYACARAVAEHKIIRGDFAFDRIIHAEYLTFLPVMEDADIQLMA